MNCNTVIYPILRRSNWFLSQFLSFDYSAQKKILIITIQCLQTEGRGHRGCSIARLPCHFSSVTVFSCFFRLIAVLSLCHCYLPLQKFRTYCGQHYGISTLSINSISIHRFFNNFSITNIGNSIFRIAILPKIFFEVATCRNTPVPPPKFIFRVRNLTIFDIYQNLGK